jgi:hypothetical protein
MVDVDTVNNLCRDLNELILSHATPEQADAAADAAAYALVTAGYYYTTDMDTESMPVEDAVQTLLTIVMYLAPRLYKSE